MSGAQGDDSGLMVNFIDIEKCECKASVYHNCSWYSCSIYVNKYICVYLFTSTEWQTV